MKNHYSEIKITPENWEKNVRANLKKDWYGYYYFFDRGNPGSAVKPCVFQKKSISL
jgi:hypothetical protein